VLSDEELIHELRQTFTEATGDLTPPADTLEVIRQLTDSDGRRTGPGRISPPRWRWPTRAVISGTFGVAVVIAVAAILLVSVRGRGTPRVDRSPAAAALSIGQSRIVARASDPIQRHGWALRETRTGQRSGCLWLGRTAGTVFLPISPRGGGQHCAQTDAAGHLFLDLAVTGDTSGNQERELAYGTLGPDATSIEYRSASGRTITEAVGADGGYLVVLPASCPAALKTASGCETTGGSRRSRELAGGAITQVNYRDGSICHLRYLAPGFGGFQRCRNVGFVTAPPRHIPTITPTQARATVSVQAIVARKICYTRQAPPSSNLRACDHGIPPGYHLETGEPSPTLLTSLRFTAPLAADNHHSVYEYSVGHAHGPHCSTGGGFSATTMRPIRKGQHVLLQDQDSPCPGTYTGLITYTPHGHPGNDRVYWDAPIHDGSLVVDRFRFIVR
jgi:hypothetical protein